MNTFNDRLIKIINDNFINDSDFATKIGIGKEKTSRIRNNKINDHKVSIVESIVRELELNPYELYELITGEVYTDNPKGAIKEEFNTLKEESEKLKAEKKELEQRSERYLKIIERIAETHHIKPYSPNMTHVSNTEQEGQKVGASIRDGDQPDHAPG